MTHSAALVTFREHPFYAIECVHTGASTRAAMYGYLVSLVLTSVQQPCSNPSESPETLRKAFTQEYVYFQVFCKLQKPPANYRTAFTRQRSLVRSLHRPLVKASFCRENVKGERRLKMCFRTSVQQRGSIRPVPD